MLISAITSVIDTYKRQGSIRALLQLWALSNKLCILFWIRVGHPPVIFEVSSGNPQGAEHCEREKLLSVVKAWVRLFCMYLYSINTSMWLIHTSVFLQWLVNIMKLKDFSLPPMQLIKLYLSRAEDGWDCHHHQKQTQRLIGGNYAG